MKPEHVIKGEIAQSLTAELLREAGCLVYGLGSNSALKELLYNADGVSRQSKAGKKLASIPDFLIVSPKEQNYFVEVKYRTDPEALEESLLMDKETLETYWEARIVVVTPKDPHFRVLAPPYFTKEEKEGWPVPAFQWKPIEKDTPLGVSRKSAEQFGNLVRHYYYAD